MPVQMVTDTLSSTIPSIALVGLAYQARWLVLSGTGLVKSLEQSIDVMAIDNNGMPSTRKDCNPDKKAEKSARQLLQFLHCVHTCIAWSLRNKHENRSWRANISLKALEPVHEQQPWTAYTSASAVWACLTQVQPTRHMPNQQHEQKKEKATKDRYE